MSVIQSKIYIAILCSLFLVAGKLNACSVPVFRFALDRWEADSYELIFPPEIYREDQTRAWLKPYRSSGTANLTFEESKRDPSPQAALFFPGTTDKPIWEGKPDQAMIERIIDSPARKELIKRLLAGDSVVFVMADSGSPADTAEAERIEKRLNFLANVAELPEIDPNDPANRMGPGPALALRFSLLRVRLDDPAEAVFLSLLRGPDWYGNPNDGPSVTPVFGRGRALFSRPLAEMDNPAIEEAALFLIGACSCQVKAQNPGWDLLLNISWEKELQRVADQNIPASDPDSEKTNDSPISTTSSQPESFTLRPDTKASEEIGQNRAPPRKNFLAKICYFPNMTPIYLFWTVAALLGILIFTFSRIKKRK